MVVDRRLGLFQVLGVDLREGCDGSRPGWRTPGDSCMSLRRV